MSSSIVTETARTTSQRDAQPLHECQEHCSELPKPANATIQPSGNLIVCERPIQIDAPIINWSDHPQFSAYHLCCYKGQNGPRADPHPYRPARGMNNRTARFRPRKELLGHRSDVGTLQRVIRQFVIHHDGADSSADCFHILHDERGLSVHLLIDTDGTIYQTLDLADVAFHAQSVNGSSIGVELCNRGLVSLPCSRSHRQHRDQRTVTVQGREYRMWSFTDAQYRSLAQLTRALARIFPMLPMRYPVNGGPIFQKLKEPERFEGLLGHYHISAEKWDPGCFEFPRLFDMVRSSRSVSLATSEHATPWTLQSLSKSLREHAHGGYFPVGTCGTERVWHGGVHLTQQKAESVVPSLLRGRIVAARMRTKESSVGSTNFVLTKHQINGPGGTATFFILYYHLAGNLATTALPTWQGQLSPAQTATTAGLEVFFPDVEILPGEPLGMVGQAGPIGIRTPQIHLEILAATEVSQILFPGRFEVRDCRGQRPTCIDPATLSTLQKPSHRSGAPRIADRSSPVSERLSRHALRFQSEWLVQGRADFEKELLGMQRYRSVTQSARDAVYHQQALPSAWLDGQVASRLGLPSDAVVWHYHPIEFLTAVEQLSAAAASVSLPSAQVEESSRAGAAQDGANGDDGYASEEDIADWSIGSGLELSTEELASGYPSHWLR